MSSDRKFLMLAAVIVGTVVAFRTDPIAGILSGFLILTTLVVIALHVRRG